MGYIDRIRNKAERQKKRAWKLGLPELTARFYLDLAKFLPARLEIHPDSIPQSITDIREADEDGVEFNHQNHRYAFTWEQNSISLPDGEAFDKGTLGLLVDGNRVLELSLDGHFDVYTGREWTTNDVRAFIEGPWVKSFKSIVKECEQQYALYWERFELEQHNQEAEDLQSRFGIAQSPTLVARLVSMVQRLFIHGK